MPPRAGENDYPRAWGRLRVNEFALGGRCDVGPQAATARRGATIDAEVQAKDVYLVLSPPRSGIRSSSGPCTTPGRRTTSSMPSSAARARARASWSDLAWT